MPTTPFQCEVLIRKDGETKPVRCDHMIVEHTSLKDAQAAYQNHLEIHKMNGSYLTSPSETQPSTQKEKGSKMKITNCPKWIKNQTLESFERDFKAWQNFSDLTPEQERGFLVEMLKVCDRDDVKEYYNNNPMNSNTVNNNVEGILVKLRNRFGKKEKEEWNDLINTFQKYKWEDNESAEKVFDKLEEMRLKFESIDETSEEEKDPFK